MSTKRIVAFAVTILVGATGCPSTTTPTVLAKPEQTTARAKKAATPEPVWTADDVLTFLLDTERELNAVLPFPEWDEAEPPIVGQCWGADKRGYWKAADVLPVLDKRMMPTVRNCRMVDFGCRIGPWIALHSGGQVYLPYKGSKVVVINATADRVIADVEEGDNDDVLPDSTLNKSVIGSGWQPTVSRYAFERGADDVWRIADKTNMWNNGDCDPGPVTLYP